MQQTSIIEKKLMPVFENEVDQSQLIFRKILKSMSEPGVISYIENSQDQYDTLWSVAQVLLDSDCSVYIYPSITQSSISRSIPFYTNSQIIEDQKRANFLFLSLDELTHISGFNLGTLEAPHLSSTVIILVDDITQEGQLTLSGPGIKGEINLSISGLSSRQVKLMQDNHRFYPCGVDFIFCSQSKMAAIPRSTIIKANSLLEMEVN